MGLRPTEGNEDPRHNGTCGDSDARSCFEVDYVRVSQKQ